MTPQRISSNATLALNIFFPVFWLVFFGSVTLALFIYDGDAFGALTAGRAKWVLLGNFLISAIILYFTVMRLRRVEADGDFIYVTNYFKTFRYPQHNVERLETENFLFIHLGTLVLKEPGRFGRKIRFLCNRQLLSHFISLHPEWKAVLEDQPA